MKLFSQRIFQGHFWCDSWGQNFSTLKWIQRKRDHANPRSFRESFVTTPPRNKWQGSLWMLTGLYMYPRATLCGLSGRKLVRKLWGLEWILWKGTWQLKVKGRIYYDDSILDKIIPKGEFPLYPGLTSGRYHVCTGKGLETTSQWLEILYISLRHFIRCIQVAHPVFHLRMWF